METDELCKQKAAGWLHKTLCVHSSLQSDLGLHVAGPQINSEHTNTKSWTCEETWLESQACGSEEQKHLSCIKPLGWQLWTSKGFLLSFLLGNWHLNPVIFQPGFSLP